MSPPPPAGAACRAERGAVERALFYVFGGLAVLASLWMVTRRNPLTSALSLVVAFLALAGLYAMLQADLLFAVQLWVYAGAIMVLFVFVIMLLNAGSEASGGRSWPVRLLGIPLLVLLLGILSFIVQHFVPATEKVKFGTFTSGGPKDIGKLLFTEYVLPFEVTSVLILIAIAGAVVLRIAFAAVTVQLLAIVGLTLAGGILLLWVCWKMYRELRHVPHAASAGAAVSHSGVDAAQPMSVWSAILQIVVADVSMSLDNVLAVAGAAKGNTIILVIGLAIAIVLMAVAANYIAKLLATYPWISWVGLAIIVYVAAQMSWHGIHDLGCLYVPAEVCKEGTIATIRTLISGTP